MTFMTAKTQDQSIDLGAFVTYWVQAAGEYVGFSQTFRLTTSLFTSLSCLASALFNLHEELPLFRSLAAASLASDHRSAPRFYQLDVDRCLSVTREHRQDGHPEFF